MAVKILGYSEKALTSMPFMELIHPEDVKKVFEAHMRIMRGEENQPVNQFRVVPLDGAVRWADSRAVVISWEGKPATVNFITDITDRKRMEDEILALSITDQLTGLYNRRGFLSLAEQQLKLSERNKVGLLLFFADLDLLKWINDTLGHEEGDKALIEAAGVLRETFRTSDIIARLGGDEYAVLAVNLTEANSRTVTARLQQLIDLQNNQENRRYKLSISIGWAYYDPETPCSIDELIARADKLMYEQKQKKKGFLL
jgi:diguanylate cyclase (GGDEF)-like protein/PAS domain S-box-containing protein